MCRFLIVKSKDQIDTQSLLQDFALMCKKSRTADGDRQGDGWGVAWINEADDWEFSKSLKPIWRDTDRFVKIPKTKMLVAHARSATFPNQKGVIEYNQPFVDGKFCFVFNGHIGGVKLPQKVEGKIGAQKLWNLLKTSIEKGDRLPKALEEIRDLVKSNSKNVLGMNIGLTDGKTITATCNYSQNEDYFSLRHFTNKAISIVCSEIISDYKFEKMRQGQILAL